MNMRSLGRCGLHAGEVGLGCEHLQGQPLETVQSVIDAALCGGVNLLDVFMPEPQVRTNIGIALRGRRERVLLQGHIGAGWQDGQYFRTREPAAFRLFFEDLLTRLQTDYIDIGMLHFVDTDEEIEKVLASGMLDYALDLKARGVVRAVGVSAHNPLAARRRVETGAIDVLMFSINPAYDILPADTAMDGLFEPATYAARETFSIDPQRLALYQACEARGVGVTVMKALGGGALLSAAASPYGAAMTVPQCIHYALTRPAVASVLVGCQTPGEMEQALAYVTATPEARDFTAVLSASPKFSMQGRCVYCNHCLPCPAHIDIAQVSKYLDLAEAGEAMPDTVRAHYAALDHTAGDCTRCGACEARCPFGVGVIPRMERARDIFGQ